MTSREDLGRLAYAAYCDMVGRPFTWTRLRPQQQAGWIHAAVTVRDRLMLGITHAYRPDEREESAMTKTTLHGGNEQPTINATDDRALFERLRAEGRDDVEWTGDGPAPGEEQQQAQREADEAAAQQQDAAAKPKAVKSASRTSRTANDVS